MDVRGTLPSQGAAFPTKHRRNQPRSKTGCLTCRGKRKKCDEAKPNCNYCTRTAQICIWPDEDNYQKEQLQPRIDTSNGDSSMNITSQQQCQVKQCIKKVDTRRNVFGKAALELPMPGLAISTYSQTRIMKRFFFDWSTHADIPPGRTMTWFSHLPQIYLKSSVDSLLHKSINTLANVSYGQRFNCCQTLGMATKLYVEAIHMLKDRMLCINDSSQYSEVMASIVLLGIYEGLVDQSIALEGSWLSHTSGGCTLLIIRGQQKIVESHAEYEVSIITFMQMIQIGLLTGLGMSASWASVKELGLPTLPYFYTHVELLYQSACLCADWKAALLASNEDHCVERLSDIAIQALALDEQLEKWVDSLPPSLYYTAESVSIESQPEWLLPLLYGPWRPCRSHVYLSLMNQVLWRFYWMARTILNQALLFTNGIFEENETTPNPIALSKAEMESNIILFTDLLCESCLSTFINVGKNDPDSCRAEDIPSLLGYITLQVLPTLGLCFEQVNIVGVDLSGRRQWIATMRHFLRVNLGVAKGAAAIPPSPRGSIPIQIWGL